MDPHHSFRLTAKNRTVILEYSALIDCRPADFLNKFLADFLIGPFSDPMSGIREEFVCQFNFKTSTAAKRVI